MFRKIGLGLAIVFLSFYAAAEDVRPVDFIIPPQPVSSALLSFGLQSELTIGFSYVVVDGLLTNGVSGSYEPAEALRFLLTGTDLTFKFIDAKTISVSKKTFVLKEEENEERDRQLSPERLHKLAVSPEAPTYEIEEVQVTARKRKESLQETPIAMTSFSAGDLEVRNLTNLMQVSSFAPNVTMGIGSASSGSSNNSQIYIRGVGQFDYLLTTDPGVGIYIDGVYLPRVLGGVMDLLDLERLEILRGPQGTLFGKNTIGGALNVISAKPTGELGGVGEVTFGNFDRIDVRGSLDFPIVDDKLFAKVAFSSKNRDAQARILDFTTRQKIGELGDEDRQAARGQLRWLVSDDVTVDINIDYTRVREKSNPNKLLQFDDAGVFGGVPAALWNALVAMPFPMSSAFISPDKDITFGTGPNHSTLDAWGMNGTIEWDLGWVAVKSITAFREMEASFGRDGDGSPNIFIQNDQDEYHEQVSEELQLFGSGINDRLQWLAGFFYFSEFGRNTNDVRLTSGLFNALEATPIQLTGAPCSPPFMAPGCPGNPINLLLDLDFTIFNEIDITSVAMFTQGTFDITDQLSVTAGVRYTHEKKEYALEHRRINSGTFIVPATTVEASWNEPSPMGSVQYQWTRDLMSYFTVSRGFKSGGFNGRPIVLAAVESFDPEFVTSYEIGAKTEWFNRRMRLNVAGFFMDYFDMQFTATSFDPASGTLVVAVDNVASAVVKGVELEMQARPFEGLYISATVGYTNFEITEIEPNAVGITTGTQQLRTPKWNASSSIQYTWPRRSYGVYRIRGDWTFEDDNFSDIQNTPVLVREAHSLINVRLTWEVPNSSFGSGWEVSVFGTNLTNERVLVNGLASLDAFGIAEGFYSRPREWGVTIKKTF